MTVETSLATSLSVLVVEDRQPDYETTYEALEQLGCDIEVKWAQDYETAREYLITTYFSLIIVDLVLDLSEEGTPDHWGGLRFIWDVVDLSLQKSRAVVVHTVHPDPQVERRAFAQYGVVDYIPKTSGGLKDLAADLQDLVEGRNYFGLACDVSFEGGLTWEEMVRVCTRRQNQALASRMSRDLARAELEGLIRLAFSNCRSIVVHPMALGASGTGLVRIEREFLDGSHGSHAVAKFGDVELIQREFDGWLYLKNYLHAARATEVRACHKGLGLGLLEYQFLGAGVEQEKPFADFYGEASADDAGHSIERLFDDTCALWYEEKNRVSLEEERLDLTYREALGIDVERLVKGYEFRFGKRCRSNDVVSHPELDRDLPHVISLISNDELRFVTDTWHCRTHGDLHSQNLLVTPEDGQCWLIDFARSGVGHWARDFAVLESSIRFQLLVNGDLGELFEFETLLASTKELGQEVDISIIGDPSTRKAALVIQRLRETAARLVDPYPRDRAFAEYLVALVFASTKLLEFHQLLDKKWRKHHVMISTGVMLDRLLNQFVPEGHLRFAEPDRQIPVVGGSAAERSRTTSGP